MGRVGMRAAAESTGTSTRRAAHSGRVGNFTPSTSNQRRKHISRGPSPRPLKLCVSNEQERGLKLFRTLAASAVIAAAAIGPALAKIFLGQIKTWHDRVIAKLNPSAKLPSQPIAVVHRSDGSGTTYNFAYYLAEVSPEWKSKVGFNTSVEWPVCIGAKGNEGV